METDRLIIRKWKEGDINDLIEGLNNINVSKWLAFVPFPYLRKNAEQWINHCIRNGNENNKSGYEFCIELKSNRKVIGGMSISAINKLNGTAGGGIWLNENYQGKGYGKEAFAEKIRFSFEELGLRRLENGFFDGKLLSQDNGGYRFSDLTG